MRRAIGRSRSSSGGAGAELGGSSGSEVAEDSNEEGAEDSGMVGGSEVGEEASGKQDEGMLTRRESRFVEVETDIGIRTREDGEKKGTSSWKVTSVDMI